MQNKSGLNFKIEIELILAEEYSPKLFSQMKIILCLTSFLSFISIYLNQEEWQRQFFYFLSLSSFRHPVWQKKAWMWMWIVFPFPFIVSDKIWRCGIRDPGECDIKVISSIFRDLYLMWRYVTTTARCSHGLLAVFVKLKPDFYWILNISSSAATVELGILVCKYYFKKTIVSQVILPQL